MRFQQLLIVHQHLHDAGREDLHEEAIFSVGWVGGDAEHADPRQMLGDLLHLIYGLADLFGQIFHGALLAQAGGDGDVGFVVGQDAGQRVVLRRIFVDLVDNAGESADHFT